MKKIALVGCGRIMARHVEAIAANPGLAIVLVCDKNEAKAKAAAEKLGVPCLTDYRQIRGADIISVLTPSGLHPRHVSNVAELTDATQIICEKPLS